MCTAVDCGVETGVVRGVETDNDIVAGLIENSVSVFCEEIDRVNRDQFACLNIGQPPMQRNILEIDTDCEDAEGKPYIKVVNHTLQDAYAVTLDTIVAHHKDGIIEGLVKALKTGEFTILHGITRIVGYYSRVSNWNKSKIGELNDRHIGNYSWNIRDDFVGVEANRIVGNVLG